MKQILVYRINDYDEGLNIEYFEGFNVETERLNRINELVRMWGNKFQIEVAGSLIEIKYQPVEVVTKYERI